ncbi:hypothetical protein AAHE18_16G089600 [Arachis hypogaea]
MNSCLHNRSNSVPSAPHPLISQYAKHFQRLKASEAASTSSISSKFNGLQALYESRDKVLLLQTMQQELRSESCKKSVDELLEGCLMLLDNCATVKDRWGESALQSEGNKYLSLRKKAKRTIQNALEIFKGFKKGFTIPTTLNTEDEFMSMIRSLKEVELFTLIQLESLLSFVYGSKAKPKMSRIEQFERQLIRTRVSLLNIYNY